MTFHQHPARTASQELTAVIPRELLPPPSTRAIDALGLDPDHPETKELVERARSAEYPRDAPTLVPCPAGCKRCSCCMGTGMITSEQAAEWRIRNAKPNSEPPPPKDAA